MGLLFTLPVFGQTLTYYSEQFKATIILDLDKMNTSNAKAYGLLAKDASESLEAHTLQGSKDNDENLTKEKSAGTNKIKEDRVLAKIDQNNKKELIKKAKDNVAKLMEQNRVAFVANARVERAQRLRNSQNSHNYNSSHDVNSKALEQLKSTNGGGWKN